MKRAVQTAARENKQRPEPAAANAIAVHYPEELQKFIP